MKTFTNQLKKSASIRSRKSLKIILLHALLSILLLLSFNFAVVANASEAYMPPSIFIFDDMEHGDPGGNGWFTFNGSVGNGGIGPNNIDLPPVDGGAFSLETGWGSVGTPGFFGGFGRNNPISLQGITHFNFWINTAFGQDYTIEVNLQDDDNGDNTISPADDDEFQYNLTVGPAGSGSEVISGGGWQLVSIPISSFFDDVSFLFGGNGVFDPISTMDGGNGQLINVVFAIISNSGADVNFVTDYWFFSSNLSFITTSKKDIELIGNGNCVADQGETFRYTVTISNMAMVQDALDVVFYSDVDPNSILEVNSVTTSQGIVTSGNSGGDTFVAVDVGAIPFGSNVTITFDVMVDIQNPNDALSCQGIVSGSNFATFTTDDPDTPTLNDATNTPLVAVTSAPDIVVFDDMEHGNPNLNNYFVFFGIAGGGIAPNSVDLPPMDGGAFSLQSDWGSGGSAGFFGGFGRTFPLNLPVSTHFNFWINPDPGQDYIIEVNLQEDDNADNLINQPDDDEFQYNVTVGPAGSGSEVISGGGWQLVSIPFTSFFDDNSFLFGGNGVFDPLNLVEGGNGQLINVVFAINSSSGTDVNFRTDYWHFYADPPSLMVTKSDSEVSGNGNGIADQGETYRYTVNISNAAMVQDAFGAVFNSGVDPNSTLVVGSITTNLGTINSGNGPGDMSVSVDIGDIPSGGSVTITFDVTIDIQFPASEISCQGLVCGSNFTSLDTDDPDTGTAGDATVTPISPPDVSFTKTAMHIDANGNNTVEQGEIIRYTLMVSNAPNVSTALGVMVDSGVDPNAELVIGSVTTDQGSVTSGNTAGDTDVSVDVGDINAGSTVTIMFDFEVTFGAQGGSIVCQATASGSNFMDVLSDDPAEPGDVDPTITAIPTLDEWGIISLALLMLIGGLLAFRTKDKYAF